MKISAFTFLRNAGTLGYPFLESIASEKAFGLDFSKKHIVWSNKKTMLQSLLPYSKDEWLMNEFTERGFEMIRFGVLDRQPTSDNMWAIGRRLS